MGLVNFHGYFIGIFVIYTQWLWWKLICSLLPHTYYPRGNPLSYDMWVQITRGVSYKIKFQNLTLISHGPKLPISHPP
jgi:hypothetical protein